MSVFMPVLAARSDGVVGTLFLVTVVLAFVGGVLRGGRRGR